MSKFMTAGCSQNATAFNSFYSFSYIIWLKLAAEDRHCSQRILTCSLNFGDLSDAAHPHLFLSLAPCCVFFGVPLEPVAMVTSGSVVSSTASVAGETPGGEIIHYHY